MFPKVFQETTSDNRETCQETSQNTRLRKLSELLRGMTRKRFYEMLKDGSISYETEQWGKKERRVIDGSELARVFPDSFKIEETTETKKSDNLKQPETTEIFIKNKLFEQEVKFLSEKLADKEKQLIEKTDFIENLSGKLDKAQSTIERQTYLIEDQKSAVEMLKTKKANVTDKILLGVLTLLVLSILPLSKPEKL